MLTALPLPQASAAAGQEMSPKPAVLPVGKESLGWTYSSPRIMGHFLGAPTPVSLHKNCGGMCRAWPLANWLWWRKREKPATPSAWILADWVPTCGTQAVPAGSFAHLQNQDGDAVCSKNSVGCKSAWCGCSKSFARPRYWSVPDHSGKRSQRLVHC